MHDDELQSRISRIETVWTVLRKAHSVDPAASAEALETLLLRYRRAVYVYLLGIVHDPDVADDVFQEFALRVVRGAFRNAQPERGRFRNLIKTTLANLITDRRRKNQRQPLALESENALPMTSSEAEADREFIEQWRNDVLAKTWEALAREDQQHRQIFFPVLQYRADHPDATSEQMAQALGGLLQRTLTAASVRQTLHRARERFAHLLVAEVRQSLATPDDDRVRDELEELGLLPYCKSALPTSAKA